MRTPFSGERGRANKRLDHLTGGTVVARDFDETPRFLRGKLRQSTLESRHEYGRRWATTFRTERTKGATREEGPKEEGETD